MPLATPLETIPISGWPFDLAATLQSGQAFHWEMYRDGFAGLIADQPVYLNQPDAHVLQCSPGMTATVRSYLGLNHDMATIAASFPQSDSVLRGAIEWCPGLRILRQPHWECLATFITSSLKQVPHIRRISLTLRERFGHPVSVSGLPVMYTYPTPSALATAGEARLRECGLGYRAAFLHRAASAIAAGSVDLDAITELPDSDSLAALCALHGVGEKIASCALLFAWERYGAFPIDVWIERALRNLYFPRRRKLSARQIRDFARRHFGPHRGYAQQFLFHWARLTDCGKKPVAPVSPTQQPSGKSQT